MAGDGYCSARHGRLLMSGRKLLRTVISVIRFQLLKLTIALMLVRAPIITPIFKSISFSAANTSWLDTHKKLHKCNDSNTNMDKINYQREI